MHQRAMHRADFGIGDLAELVVAEVVGVCALFAHDPPLPQLVERAHQIVFINVAGSG
jgi:hypothetical protein